MNSEELHIQFRFPLFRNEKWDLHKLSEIAEYTNGRAHEQDIETNGKYIVVNSKYISTDGEVVKYSNTANCLAEKNDILMVLSDVPNGRAIAKCYLVKEDNKYTVNQRICKITPKQGIESSLLYYLMNRNPYFLSFDDGVKQTNLRNDNVLNFEILLPTNPAEQQKIASCLSNLDDVIARHEEKLSALEEHKKGLMQNLFPQEGETQPKYRFPEFENDGDWVEKKLGDIANRITLKNKNSQITQIFTNSAEHGIVNQRDFFDKDIANQSNIEGYYIVEPGDFVYNPRVSSFAPVGPIAKNNKNYAGAVSPLYTVFRFINPINDFYVYYFKTKHWFNAIRKIANTGARFDRMSITASQFMEIEVLMTSIKEQQKIASVLSSVDELIVAQREKIEALKEHKKGLKQGLFPKIES